MLRKLRVKNFALINQVEIEFSEGLNILSGETGAGKSILIDALGAVLGEKTSIESIRRDSDFFMIEAEFDEMILSRRLSRSGRNLIKIDGKSATLGELREIGKNLVEIHGQHESLELLKSQTPMDLLDAWIDQKLLTRYQEIFDEWNSKRRELDESRKNFERRELLDWQLKENDAAQILPNEFEDLEREIKKLSHAEKIAMLAENSRQLLDGNSESEGILTDIARLKKNLEDLLRFDDSLENAMKMLDDAMTLVQESSYEIRSYTDSLEFSPELLDEKQSRLEDLDKLRRKYGDPLEYRDKISKELERESNIAELESELREIESRLQISAEDLTLARIEASREFSRRIELQLQSLGMLDAKFQFEFKSMENFSPRGKDSIAILFSANAGESPKNLSKVASGGELSRISLAIQTILPKKSAIVFDEIDSGLGGRTALQVAELIREISKSRQSLCVTHLPQIASVADVHISIEKISVGDRTVTRIHHLNSEERIHEIARMSSGDESVESLENARAMLRRNFGEELRQVS